MQENPFENIFEIVRQIPLGKVATYGQIASWLPGVSARMVGWAMNKSKGVLPPVPAHRVVNRKGELTGRNFFDTPSLMQELLEREGIKVLDNQIVDFAKHRWTPEST